AATPPNVNLSPVEPYIDVAFTMRMDAATLGAISTYSVPGVTITAVTVNTKNSRSVRLSYTGTLTLPASVTVNGARSFSGIPVNGTPTSPIQQVPLTSLDIGTPGADPIFPST